MSDILTNSLDSFPKQQIPDAEKNEKWFKKNLEAGIQLLTFDNDTGVRESRQNKYINYQLGNNILSRKDMESIINHWNLQGFDFPDDLQNYPLINPKIDLLVGESIKRLFQPRVVAVNSDAISDKEEFIKNKYLEFAANKVMQETFDEKQVQAELDKLNKWKNWNSQDLRERMCQQILDYHYKYQRFDLIFKNGMKDLLYAGEEMYRVYIKGGDPAMERMNPLEVITLQMGNSYKIENAEKIVHSRRMPIGQVFDEFYEELGTEDAKKLEIAAQGVKGATGLFVRPQSLNPDFNINNYLRQVGINNVVIPTYNGINIFGGAFDSEGNVLVNTVYWKSRRKMGKLSYYDEFGELVVEYVTENYKPIIEKGEKVEWFWINEWCEATKIANDIYTRMRVWPYNNYGIDNFVLKTSPIVGVIANLNSNKAMSMVDRARPYQYLYNAFMYNAKKAFMKSRGKVAVLDTALMPEGWTPDKYLFYLDEMNIMWVDSFKEGNKGAAMGKMAGNMASQQREINLEMGNVIQQYLLMLNYLRSLVGEITGVSDARQGQIETRELVGNVNREVIQSSHITEEWFSLHDEVKVQALTMFIEIAKQAYRGRKEKRAYILDDMSGNVLDIDGDKLNEAEYGIFVENSSEADAVMQKLQALAQAWAQNDKLNISQAAMLFSTKSPSVMTRKFQEYEQEAIAREQEAQQQQLQSNEAIAQQAAAIEQDKLRIEEDKNIRDDGTKRYIAELSADKEINTDVNDNDIDDGIDREKLRLQEQKQQIDKDLKTKQLEESKRHNLATESISKNKPKSSK